MQDYIFKMNEDGTYAVVAYKGDEAQVVIPGRYGDADVTIIGDKLFSGHDEITSVTIPDKITDMGEFIFDGCVNLKSIELPASLENLWGATFVRCGLEEITLPDGLKTLPPYAFKECQNLRKVVCGKGLKKIYSWVFAGCVNEIEIVKNGTVGSVRRPLLREPDKRYVPLSASQKGNLWLTRIILRK